MSQWVTVNNHGKSSKTIRSFLAKGHPSLPFPAVYKTKALLTVTAALTTLYLEFSLSQPQPFSSCCSWEQNRHRSSGHCLGKWTGPRSETMPKATALESYTALLAGPGKASPLILDPPHQARLLLSRVLYLLVK